MDGVNDLQYREQVVNIDQPAQQAQPAGFGGVGGFHKAGVAARVQAAKHGADALGFAQAGGTFIYFGTCIDGIVIAGDRMPGFGIQAADLTAFVVADIAAGHAGFLRLFVSDLRPHHAAAGHAVGGAVADGRQKDFQAGERAVNVNQTQNLAVVQNACYVAGLHFTDIAAGCLPPDDVGEVMGVGILNMAAVKHAGKATGMANLLLIYCSISPHGIAAVGAIDIGMFNGGYNDIERLEHIAQTDAIAQNLQAAAHTGRAADIDLADVAAGIAPAGNSIARLGIIIITGVIGNRRLRVWFRLIGRLCLVCLVHAGGIGDLGVAQEIHVTVRNLRAAGVAGKAAGAARVGIICLVVQPGGGYHQAQST